MHMHHSAQASGHSPRPERVPRRPLHRAFVRPHLFPLEGLPAVRPPRRTHLTGVVEGHHGAVVLVLLDCGRLRAGHLRRVKWVILIFGTGRGELPSRSGDAPGSVGAS
jgi:hypothetical protein